MAVTGVRRVLVVGLGTIAQTHLTVLAQRADVTVVAGVDPVVDATTFPVFRTLTEALLAEPDPDLVVVATPTDTHVGLVREVVDSTAALVLSEKPLATTLAEIDTSASSPTGSGSPTISPSRPRWSGHDDTSPPPAGAGRPAC